MRTRCRFVEPISVVTEPIYATYGAGRTDYGTYTLNSTLSYEQIVDSTSGRAGLGGGMVNLKPCYHQKWGSTAPQSNLLVGQMGAGPVYTIWHCSPWQGMAYAIDSLKPCGQVDLGAFMAADLRSYSPSPSAGHYDRWEESKPTLSTRSNLSVFLYELRDLRRMFNIIPPKHLRSKWNAPVKNWREALKYANGQHLNYNFGWKPFVKEVKNVFNGVADFNERLQRFKENAGHDLKRSRRGSASTLTSSETYCSEDNTFWSTTVTRTYEFQHASTFMYSYSIPNYGYSELRMRGMADTLGLHLNPATIWECIPWSFVVDWFYDVGSHLNQFSSDWVTPYINFSQACTSVKVVGHSEWVTKALFLNGQPTMATGECDLDLYHRVVGIPGFQAPDPPTLDSDKIRLLSSLFASRIL